MILCKVVVQPNTLARGAHAITGDIALRCGEGWFPNQDWNDLPVPLLRAWLPQLHLWSRGEVRERRCHFMEDDYAFLLRHRPPALWEVGTVDRNGRPSIVEVDPKALLASALHAAQGVLSVARTNAWDDPDLAALAIAVSEAGAAPS